MYTPHHSQPLVPETTGPVCGLVPAAPSLTCRPRCSRRSSRRWTVVRTSRAASRPQRPQAARTTGATGSSSTRSCWRARATRSACLTSARTSLGRPRGARTRWVISRAAPLPKGRRGESGLLRLELMTPSAWVRSRLSWVAAAGHPWVAVCFCTGCGIWWCRHWFGLFISKQCAVMMTEVG